MVKERSFSHEDAEPPDSFLPAEGECLGAYRILRRLGRGGMGEVFLAYDKRLKRSVAIKRVLQGKRAGCRQRFRREAELAAQLSHPAVVRVYDMLERPSGDFLVMEYVQGVTLAQKLQSGPLSPARIVPLALQIVAGLQEAHAKGLVHRDLKAENVIVDQDGQAKILDFGLAKLAEAEDADPDLTREGELLGTSRAMSPEQVGGGPVDHRSDLFSLGVLLYEMVSGCSPFRGESLSETLRNILTSDPPPVSSLVGQAWPELDRLIAALLARNPKQRPQSAREVQAALCRIAGRPERQAQPHAEGLLAEGALNSARTGSFPAQPAPPGLTEPLLERGLARRKRTLARLPVPATAFVGRQADLAEIEERLTDPSCRLLTLVGPGGTGKTRLALEVARQQRHSFEGQVLFIPLDASRPELLEATLAESLQITLDPHGDPEVQLANWLAEARMILVLDNFEHLTQRADLLASLVAAAPQVKILVTSREGLNLQCEWLQEVGGLDLPPQGNLNRLEDFSAVQLFQQAARRVRKDFALSDENRRDVVEICRLVDGLPLGIELAANWLRVLSGSEVRREIRTNLDLLSTTARDLPQRHRSLRAVFSSSVALLGEQERDVFRRLSVFRGGFDRQAAQTVAGASPAVLLELVNKSMLSQVASPRFVMHGLLRQYSAELLEEDAGQSSQVRQRHCRYFLDFLARHEADLVGKSQPEALEAIHPEVDNVRSAWSWAVCNRLLEPIGQCLESVYRFFLLSSRFAEAEKIFGSALAVLSRETEPSLWARTAVRQGRFYIFLGHLKKARQLLEESLAIFRHLEEHAEIAFSLFNLGEISLLLGEFDTARQLSEECAACFRLLNDRMGTAISLSRSGRIAGARGKYEQSRCLLNESLAIYEEIGARDKIANCMNSLGCVAIMTRSYLEAIRMFQQGLEIFTRLGDRQGRALCLNNLGLVYVESGQHEKAKGFLHRGLSICREIGHRHALATVLETLGRATFGLKEYERAKQFYGEALKTAMAIQSIPIALAALLGLARLLVHQGKDRKAWELLTFINSHPKIMDESRMQVSEVQKTLQARLSAEERAEVEKCRSEKELGPLVREVLVDLQLGTLSVQGFRPT